VLDTRLLTLSVDTGTPDPSENLVEPSMVAFRANKSLSSEMLARPLDVSELAEVSMTAGVYEERVSLTEGGANTDNFEASSSSELDIVSYVSSIR